MAVSIRLVLVTNAVAEREVRPYAPVILPVNTDVSLRNGAVRISLRDAEARRATAEQTNTIVDRYTVAAESLLRAGKPILLNQGSTAISVQTAEHDVPEDA